MKKKKQTRKIKQWLAAALGLTLLGIGLWAGMNGEKLQAEPKSDINVSPKGDEGTEWPPLPDYQPNPLQAGKIDSGGWLDSMTSYIPRSNANTLKYLPGKTKIVAHSTGVHPDILGFNITNFNDPNIGREVEGTIAFDTDQPQWIQIENVGFADGKFFGLEIELKAKKPSGRDELHASYIYVEQEHFLQVNTAAACEGMAVTYKLIELTDVKDISTGKYISQPIEAGSYSSFGLNNTLGKYEVFSQNNIKNIYSLSRPETSLQYEVDNASKELKVRTLTFAGEYATREFTITSNDKSQFTTNLQWSNPSNHFGDVGLYYRTDSLVKVEIPDPQATAQTYTEIIGEDKGILSGFIEPLNYGFIQQIPWESASPINNRTQLPSWKIENPTQTSDVISPEVWSIAAQDDPDLADGNVIGWFNNSGIQGSARLTPKGDWDDTVKAFENGSPLASDDFYGHFYLFKRELPLKYTAEDGVTKNRVNKDLLTKDGINYFMSYNGTVSLDVDDKHKVSPGQDGMYVGENETTYETKINFYAPIEYKYIDSVTKAEIPADSLPDSDKATGDGIVTWDAPLTPMRYGDYEDDGTITGGENEAPVIPGYTFKEAKLNDGDDFQVKVTKLLKDGGDAKKAEDYTQNNVVTLEYQPTYTVDVQVGALVNDEFSIIAFDPAAGTVAPYVTIAEKNAPQVPTNGTQTGTDADFNFGTYQFDLGTKSYQVQQVAAVNENYDMPDDGIAIDFSINSSSQLVVGTDVVTTKEGEIFVYKDAEKPYILRWDPATKKLTIQMINFPQGEVEIEGEEIEGEYRVDDIDFGNVTIPAQADIVRVPETKEDGKFPTLVVVDTRLPAYRKDGWRLSVYMSKAFTAVGGTDKIEGILYYKSQSLGSASIPFDEGTTPVPIEAMTPATGSEQETASVWSTPIALGSAVAQDGLPAEGFYLNINKPTQLGIKAGEYQAELTFSVENSAFTTSPGRSK